MPAARVIQEEAGIGRTPIGQHTHQLAFRDQFLDLCFEHIGKAGAVERGVDHQILIVQSERPLDVDIDLDAAALEFPAIERAAGETIADAWHAFQIMGRNGRLVSLEIAW